MKVAKLFLVKKACKSENTFHDKKAEKRNCEVILFKYLLLQQINNCCCCF